MHILETVMPKSDKPAKPGKTDKTAPNKPSVEIEISDEELDKASGGAEFTASVECGTAAPTRTVGVTRR
jgi:hypothetical protein